MGATLEDGVPPPPLLNPKQNVTSKQWGHFGGWRGGGPGAVASVRGCLIVIPAASIKGRGCLIVIPVASMQRTRMSDRHPCGFDAKDEDV